MERGFWEEKWGSGQVGFHQSDLNRHLLDHAEFLCAGETGRVLVPLCGKTRDMDWLRGQFREVVGVELVEDAVRAWFEEHELPYRREHHDFGVVYAGDRITLYSADFFDLTPTLLGRLDAVYDRASMIALPDEMRRRYADHLTGLVEPGARALLITLEYDQSATHGPPFSVEPEEVRALYGDGFELEYFQTGRAQTMPPRFEDIAVYGAVWQMVRKAD